MKKDRNLAEEKFYEKYAWILLFSTGLIGMVGIYPFLLGIEPSKAYFINMTGITWDQFLGANSAMVPYVQESLRLTGVLFLGMGILISVISATSFRKGERWAWYVMWYFFILIAGITWLLYIRGATEWDSAPLHAVLTVMCLLGILLPVRKFFRQS